MNLHPPKLYFVKGGGDKRPICIRFIKKEEPPEPCVTPPPIDDEQIEEITPASSSGFSTDSAKVSSTDGCNNFGIRNAIEIEEDDKLCVFSGFEAVDEIDESKFCSFN